MYAKQRKLVDVEQGVQCRSGSGRDGPGSALYRSISRSTLRLGVNLQLIPGPRRPVTLVTNWWVGLTGGPWVCWALLGGQGEVPGRCCGRPGIMDQGSKAETTC